MATASSMRGTHLLDLISTSNAEVASFGNTSNGAFVRMYDSDRPLGATAASNTAYLYGLSNGNFMVLKEVGETRLGIGTRAPLSNLHVEGSAFVKDRLTASNINFTGSLLQNGAPYIGSQWTKTGTAITYTAGRVGVGTTNPQYTFHAYGGDIGLGGTNPSLLLARDAGGSIQLAVPAVPGWFSTSAAAGDSVMRASGTGKLHIQNSGGGAAAMTILSDGKVGVGVTTPAALVDVNGTLKANSSRIAVQDGQDGGANRGIYMWSLGDTNWGIYMGTPGAGKSLSGGTATAGYGFGSHSIRFRTYFDGGNGFIFENSAEQLAASIRASDGFAYFRGGVQTDGPIIPSVGNSGGKGIMFPTDPGGGSGDAAYIRYYSRGGESTTFEMGIANDGDDIMVLTASGGVGINTNNVGLPLNVFLPASLASVPSGSSLYYTSSIALTTDGNTSRAWDIGVGNGTSYSDNIAFFCYSAGYDGRRAGARYIRGYILGSAAGNELPLNFTGQHRCFVKDKSVEDLKAMEGLIVSANNNDYVRMSGGIAKGQDAVTINESLPVVSLSTKEKDKAAFGVISLTEDPDKREDAYGNFVTPYEKEKGDTRAYVNSVGEGAVWVCSKGGALESGDYITTSSVPGYGQRQADDLLHNYTVAKITMDCDFRPRTQPIKTIKKLADGKTNDLDALGNLQWVATDKSESTYRVRYVKADGAVIDKADYEARLARGEEVYVAAFVGCTYHCG